MPLNIPADVADHILCSLPDFGTLATTLRISKNMFYSVFQTRPTSILRAIAFNVAGPAFPQAYRIAIAVQQLEEDDEEDDYELYDIDQLDTPLHLQRKHTIYLEQNARVASILEDLFSMRSKDRRTTKSCLTPSESFRFKRALYRCWGINIFQQLHKEDDPQDNTKLTEQFLAKLSTTEILELACVRAFLLGLVDWICAAAPTSVVNPNEFDPPPNVIMEAYEKCEINDMVDFCYDSRETYDEAFANILRKRNIDADNSESERAKRIVDEVFGLNDQCHRCNAVQGVRLWGKNNWHYLQGYLKRSLASAELLPGLLCRNQTEMTLFRWHIAGLQGAGGHIFARLVEDIFDLEDGNWDKTQWYCLNCIRELMMQRLWKWWREQKVQGGAVLNEDCWYGYNCRTQTHRRYHAERLNHLCEPTRGDSPQLLTVNAPVTAP
ncbi:hypothetical protein K474DRAFT_1663274 [Panus rudis PR-1116 ss-1]|nr:hypothetical protein K474DRAFT_1663274 [Panus rudis PR-1116 ss-1]